MAIEMLVRRVAEGGEPTLVGLACENQYLVRWLVAKLGSFQKALSLAGAIAQAGLQPAAS